MVAGILFLLSMFFNPLFSAIPSAGTSPILIIVGMVLFKNVVRIDFVKSKYAVPGYVCMILIPFTNSVVYGVAVGYVVYIAIMIITGDIRNKAREFVDQYFPLEDDNKGGGKMDSDKVVEMSSISNDSSSHSCDNIVAEESSHEGGGGGVAGERDRNHSSDSRRGGGGEDDSAPATPIKHVSMFDQVVHNPRSNPRRASMVFLEKLFNEVDSKNSINKQII